MQPSHNLSNVQSDLVQPHTMPCSQIPMHNINSVMQPRPDCRLALSAIPNISGQSNSNINYPSCMMVNNNHLGHLEQTDPLNYEPYIWSF